MNITELHNWSTSKFKIIEALWGDLVCDESSLIGHKKHARPIWLLVLPSMKLYRETTTSTILLSLQLLFS